MKPAIITALTFAAAASASTAGAQSYLTKPIRFIAAEVLGSATDIQARIIARGMAPLLGQPIEIENVFGERTITCASANRRAGRRPDPVVG